MPRIASPLMEPRLKSQMYMPLVAGTHSSTCLSSKLPHAAGEVGEHVPGTDPLPGAIHLRSGVVGTGGWTKIRIDDPNAVVAGVLDPDRDIIPLHPLTSDRQGREPGVF